ncbi:hypothetical protein [Streptomyces pratensis]|nr:hypothetical protein [Streptomyces pratensis]
MYLLRESFFVVGPVTLGIGMQRAEALDQGLGVAVDEQVPCSAFREGVDAFGAGARARIESLEQPGTSQFCASAG